MSRQFRILSQNCQKDVIFSIYTHPLCDCWPSSPCSLRSQHSQAHAAQVPNLLRNLRHFCASFGPHRILKVTDSVISGANHQKIILGFQRKWHLEVPKMGSPIPNKSPAFLFGVVLAAVVWRLPPRRCSVYNMDLGMKRPSQVCTHRPPQD